MTRALITGGAGFLGSHLCELFLERAIEYVMHERALPRSAYSCHHRHGADRDVHIHILHVVEARAAQGQHAVTFRDTAWRRWRRLASTDEPSGGAVAGCELVV